MIISNLEEAISILRSHLPQYLMKKGIIHSHEKEMFRCIIHNDSSPSMHLNPKTNNELVTCFGCGKSLDIFGVAEILDNLPRRGREWITETIPALAQLLNLQINLGEPSEQDILRGKFFAIARDIADILQHPKNIAADYIKARQWANEYEDCYSINFEELMSGLLEKGWLRDTINASKLITSGINNHPLLGEDKVTWIIRDIRGRPISFISRFLSGELKYVHSSQSPIFSKKEVLAGIDLSKETLKHNSFWIVEGPGDRFALLKTGTVNVGAVCSAALTEEHLLVLKSHGVRDIILCLDWDSAGQEATERIVSIISTKKINGLSIKVAYNESYKDIDAFLIDNELSSLTIIDYFDWIIKRTDLTNSDEISKKIIPIIASHHTAIKREQLASKLADITSISLGSILNDVDKLRNFSYEERKERLVAAAERYKSNLQQDPTNSSAILSLHEKDIDDIDQEYNKNSFGTNYQLSRFDSLEESKLDTSVNRTTYEMNTYSEFKRVMSSGLPWTTGTLFYFGGRENAAKTGVMIALALDIVISDPDAIALFHFTDDALSLVMPRLITNTSYLMKSDMSLSIEEAGCPAKGFLNQKNYDYYKDSVSKLRELITEERLICIDSEDGANLSTLERSLKYIRKKYPHKKILIVLDNCFNLTDFHNLESTARMTRIADILKSLSVKYQSTLFSSAEYRKYDISNTQKIRLPTNDDLADARALKYRASVIIHVYNDLNDRGDEANVFHIPNKNTGKAQPRLLLVFGKNKISSFKQKLVMDLHTDSVCLSPITYAEAKNQSLSDLKIENGYISIDREEDEDE